MVKLYIDSDGILTNTSKKNCARLGLKYPSYIDDVDMADYGWVKKQVDPEKFYHSFKGQDFWTELDAYPWARDLLDHVNNLTLGNFKILTRAMDDPECFSGKYIWWKRHFPEFLGKLIITGPRFRSVVDGEEIFNGGEKEFFANSPNDILVDDHLKNIGPWLENGGSAIWWKELPEDAPRYIIEDRKMQITMTWACQNNESLNLIKA